jgi:ribonuclease VapC
VSECNILDASAILALLAQEKGKDLVLESLRARPTRVSSVNVCEVLGRLYDGGMQHDIAIRAMDALRMTVVDFDYRAALEAAALKSRTKSIGASLGDRACLALAHAAHKAGDTPTVLTADRLWARIHWPFKVTVIR